MIIPRVQSILSARFPNILFDEPMSRHTTMGVGGPVDFYLSVEDLPELTTIRSVCRENAIPLVFVGSGSNLVVTDAGIEGGAIRMCGVFAKAEWKGLEVRAGAAVPMPALARQAADHGLTGLEWMIGVPGSLGGGVAMNAGALGSSISDVVKTVTVLDDQDRERGIPRKKVRFGYRTSGLETMTVLNAVLHLKKGKRDQILDRIHEHMRRRSETQPLGLPSCGSVFRNPPNDFAGRLIEKAGLKGAAIGGASVSERHANFIVNTGGASASDVLRLMELVERTVLEKEGVILEPEVRILGR